MRSHPPLNFGGRSGPSIAACASKSQATKLADKWVIRSLCGQGSGRLCVPAKLWLQNTLFAQHWRDCLNCLVPLPLPRMLPWRLPAAAPSSAQTIANAGDRTDPYGTSTMTKESPSFRCSPYLSLNLALLHSTSMAPVIDKWFLC